MEKTTRLGFTFLKQYQNRKEIIVNENFNKIDTIFNKGVISCSVNEAPTNSNFGDIFIVPEEAKGEWNKQENNIAIFMDEWEYLTPSEGSIYWVIDEEKLAVFSKSQWKFL